MKIKKIKSKSDISKEDSYEVYLIDADEKVARAMIASLKDSKSKSKIAILGRDDGFNRRAVETLKIDYLVSPERGEKKDTLKQRDSGINHVVAKEAKEKNIVVVVDFDEISKLDKKQRALRISRVIQNVRICRKAGCKIEIWGSADEKGLKSFGESLGMSSLQVRDCLG
jgi:RNase P/RNase MRP subunit p30